VQVHSSLNVVVEQNIFKVLL